MKSARFLISLSLQRWTIASRGIKSKRQRISGDKTTQCSRTLHTVTDKIGSQRLNEEAKHRDEYHSRRFSESVVRMSFKDTYTWIVIEKHEFIERWDARL